MKHNVYHINDWNALLAAAQRSIAQGRSEDAFRLLKRCIENHPPVLEPYLQLAAVSRTLGHDAEELHALKYLSSQGLNAEDLWRRALELSIGSARWGLAYHFALKLWRLQPHSSGNAIAV